MSANRGSSFGARLQRERQSRGISLAAVVEYTKISPKNLRALESNRFHELPGGFYNRSFVRAYAEFLGINPDFMVRAYEEEVRSIGPVDARAAGPRRAFPPPRVPRLRWLHWPLVVALATCAAAGLTFGRWLRAYAEPMGEPVAAAPVETRQPALPDLALSDRLCREASSTDAVGDAGARTAAAGDPARILDEWSREGRARGFGSQAYSSDRAGPSGAGPEPEPDRESEGEDPAGPPAQPETRPPEGDALPPSQPGGTEWT